MSRSNKTAAVINETVGAGRARDILRSQYMQHGRKVVMLAGMPTSSHKDVKR